jgi:hypothetical protein
MRWFAACLACLLWLAALPAAAQPPDPAGNWAMEADGRNLFVIALRRDRAAPGGWSGEWIRPDRFTIGGAHWVSGIAGPIVRRRILRAAADGDGIDLTIAARMPAEAPDVFTFRLRDAGHAELGLKDRQLPPFALVRAAPDAAVAADWDTGRAYPLVAEPPSNAEMSAIYEADQADRRAGAAIDWATVTPRDEARRTRTRALLDAGALRSGEDFQHAAFVFQHGSTPDDYLLAHSLAIAAVARGRPDAAWIAAATLDRFLQTIGRSQIYGTQFHTPRDGPTTQAPYDRALLPDSLREALGVPDQAGQERQRAAFEAEYRRLPAAPAPPPAPR